MLDMLSRIYESTDTEQAMLAKVDISCEALPHVKTDISCEALPITQKQMPATGIEPVREYKSRRILSPVRLPVPPRRHFL